MMRLPLRYQILALVSLLLVGAMSAYLALALRLTMRDKVAYVYEVNAAVARAKADEVHGHLGSLTATLGFVAAGGRCKGKAGAEAARAALESDPELLTIDVWAPGKIGALERECGAVDDKRLAAMGLAPETLQPIPPDAAILAQIDSDGIALRNESLPPSAAVLTVVGRAPDRRVIVLRVKPDRLLRLFEERRAYQSWLVDGQGNVLAHPDAASVVARTNLLHVPIVQDALQGSVPRGVREYRDRDERYLGAYAHVGVGRLAVVTAVPRRVALSAVAELMWRTLLMAIAAVLAALLSAVFFARALTDPLSRLEAAVDALRGGHLGIHVPIRSQNEIGRLASAFNHMSRELLERERNLKEAQARLLRSDRLAVVGTLAAGVAHEINNPLTYIHSNLDFALNALRRMQGQGDHGAAAKEATAAVNEALEGAERVRDIVSDLRVFSRASDDSRAFIDIREVLDGAMKLIHGEVGRRAVVERDDEPGLPRVYANRGRLGQVFLNLLVNAMQAIPTGEPERHRIKLATRSKDGRVVVSITDTGAGIPAEIRDRIFDPFFTTKPVGEGTGLGLSIVHGIVTSSGGTIEVESEPGKGTTFRVSLPTAENAAAIVAPSREEKMRVVVVAGAIPDDAITALVTCEVTRSTGTVDVLARFASSAPPELALASVRIGLELHAELRARGQGHERRIVFVVDAETSDEQWQLIEDAGNDWVERTADAAALEHALSRACRAQNGSGGSHAAHG